MAEQMPKLKRYSTGSFVGLLYDEHKRPGSRYVRACGAPLELMLCLQYLGAQQGSLGLTPRDLREQAPGRRYCVARDPPQ